MKVRSYAVLAGSLAAAAALAVGVSAADEKTPTVKEVMAKMHGKTEPLLPAVTKAAKAEKWEDAAKGAAEIKVFGSALGKNDKPKKGDKESWEKLTKEYGENTTALTKAVDDKDKDAVAAAAKTIEGSCKACHTAHRGK